MTTSTSSSTTADACAITTRAGSAAGCGRRPTPHTTGCSLTWVPSRWNRSFDGAWLHGRLRGRTAPIKNLLMDSRIVAGVGNIYANEALFIAGIDPRRAGGRVSRRRIDRLAHVVREVLTAAVEAGGTTLRDYARTDGDNGRIRQPAERVRAGRRALSTLRRTDRHHDSRTAHDMVLPAMPAVRKPRRHVRTAGTQIPVSWDGRCRFRGTDDDCATSPHSRERGNDSPQGEGPNAPTSFSQARNSSDRVEPGVA